VEERTPVHTPAGRLRQGWPDRCEHADDVLVVQELRHVDVLAVRRCGALQEDGAPVHDLEVVAAVSIPTSRFLERVGAAVDALRRRSPEPGRRRDDPCWCGADATYLACHGGMG
jgi:hypothetical protein